jgi:hypothetical protein
MMEAREKLKMISEEAKEGG